MKTKTGANKLISTILTLAVVLGLFAATPLTAHAANTDLDITAIPLVMTIQKGIQNAINAASSGDTITVTGTKSGITSKLNLNIKSGVKVIWKASFSGAVDINGQGMIDLTGAGTFEVAAGGLIKQTGGMSYTLYVHGSVNVRISGGTISTSRMMAIYSDGNGNIEVLSGTVENTGNDRAIQSSYGSNRTIKISGGTVRATGSGSAIFSHNSADLTIAVSGGKVENTGSGRAIESESIGTVINVSDGTVSSVSLDAVHTKGKESKITVSGNGAISSNTGRAIYAQGAVSSVTVSGGTVSSSKETSICAPDAASLATIKGGTTRSGGAVAAISTSNVTMSGGKVENTGTGDTILGSSISISGGTVSSNALSAVYASADYATIEISGGALEASGAEWSHAVCTGGMYAVITVSGGTLKGVGTKGTICTKGAETVVRIEGGAVSTTTGLAINAMGSSSAVQVSGTGKVSAGTGNAIDANEVAISGGTVSAAGAKYAIGAKFITISGGKVENTGTGNAVEALNTTVSGGVVSAKNGYAVAVNDPGSLTVSDGFVFAYGTNITGNNNSVIKMMSGTPAVSGNAVICAWNKPSGTPKYDGGSSTALLVNPGVSAVWAIHPMTGDIGIAYMGGSTGGFFPVGGVTVVEAPTAPSNLTAVADASGIILHWKDNSDNETGFVIERKESGGGWGQLDGVGANITTYKDSNVQTGKTYTYKVSATVSGLSSGYSNEATATMITITLPSSTTYKVTVNSGTGGGSYAAGAKVNITASAAPSGKMFDKWTTSDGVTLANAANSGTFFTMPSKEVTVTATYKDLPAGTYAVNVTAGIGGTANANVTYAQEGDTVTLTAEEGEGYMFKTWDVVSGGVILTGGAFTMPGNSVTINAVFEAIPGETTMPGVTASVETPDPASLESSTGPDNAVGQGHDGGNGTWLWILLIALAAVAAGGGIAFILIRKKEQAQHKNISKEAK